MCERIREKVNIRIQKNQDEIYILELHGSLDLYSSDRIKELVMRLIELKIERFILDLKNVDRINSAGIGALVNISSTLKKLNLALAITNIKGPVKKAVEITKLSGLLPISPTLREAVEKTRAGLLDS